MPERNARQARGSESEQTKRSSSHTGHAHPAHTLAALGVTPSPSQMLSIQAHVGNQAALGMASTALPHFDKIKASFENPETRSHHGDDKAAVSALAYAQGADIHMKPGQEKHLPHESWHSVQQ
ncbi:hypothetical protein [Cohnella soli]|uniref:DUF4157 domain-containing protein n=1 Tax=Cohnella soli TaxID=425005 RepID=A0ABW0HVF3_9BACL